MENTFGCLWFGRQKFRKLLTFIGNAKGRRLLLFQVPIIMKQLLTLQWIKQSSQNLNSKDDNLMYAFKLYTVLLTYEDSGMGIVLIVEFNVSNSVELIVPKRIVYM